MKDKKNFLKESSTETLANEIPGSVSAAPLKAPDTASTAAAPLDGLAELKALEAQVSTSKPGRKETEPGSAAEPGADSPGASKPSKRKFKVRPENTFRMGFRQYWRLRDWMARRALGLPSEYAGVFIQGKDAQLVEPLIDPTIGILETYWPDAIIFIEEKSPLIQLFIALAEVEQTFAAGVNAVALELKAKTPAGKTETHTEAPQTKFPSLKETTGGK